MKDKLKTWTRRAFNFLIVAALAVVPMQTGARGIHGGIPNGSGPPPGGLVTTLAIVNTSGSTQTTNFVTQIFGHPFKKGDVPNGCSGGAPVFQLVGGTNVPFSEGLHPVCWGDGSLEWAPFMLKVPTTVGGSYAISSGTYNNGTGVIVITTASTPTGVSGGSIVNIDGLTGSGNWGALTGTYTVASVVGSNVTINGPTGMGTSAITGGTLYQALTINILSGGTKPTASGFSASNLTAGGHDPNVKVTGLSNLSGTYVSDLAKAISEANADNVNYMDGQAGAVQRLRDCFHLTNTSGACHGQLEGYFYVQEIADSGGAFGYARWMHRLSQPWYDVASPHQSYRTFSAWATYDGASLAKNMFSTQFGVSNTFTWDSVNGFFVSSGYVSGAAFVIQVSNTGGGFPTGLAANTDYFQNPGSATHATWFNLANGNSTGASQIFPSSNCTGTCSFIAYPYVPPFGSLFTANITGLYDFFQGNGSVSADSHVRITFNNTYWRSTRMIPPYAIGSVPVTPYANISSGATGGGQNVNHIVNYIPNSLGSTDNGVNGTGESDWIGPEPMWVSSHVFLQDAADENLIRASSLDAQAMPVMLLNSSTHTIPVVNITTYSGMPTGNTSLYWSGSSSVGASGIQPVDNSNMWLGVYSTIDFSHMPEWDYYALLAFGQEEYEDNLLNWANAALIHWPGGNNPGTAIVSSQVNAMGGIGSNGPAIRNFTVNGTTYYGVSSEFDDLARQEAWTTRTEGLALALATGDGQAAASIHTYLTDIMKAQFGAEAAYIGMLPAYAQFIGTFNEAESGATGQSQSWAQGYHMMALSYITAVNDSPTWGNYTLGNHMAKFWKFLDSTFGVWVIPTYEYLQREFVLYNTPGAGSQDFGVYLTSAADFAICGTANNASGGNWTIGWSAGSPAFTMTTFPTGYILTNGDVIRFWGNGFGTPPTELTSFGPYGGYFHSFYVVNANNSTKKFDLSNSLGGSAISISSTGSGDVVCAAPYGMKSATTTSINDGALGSGYMQNETGALNWWQAVGGAVDSTTITDMRSNLSAIGGYVPNDAKYAFQQTF
jgi:hypothetical protein